MNARDELSGILEKHEDCAFSASGVLVCSCGVAMQPQQVMDDMANLASHQADVLLAAGYRKPRTITTAEELDNLPLGSVIILRDSKHDPHPAQKGKLGWRLPFVDEFWTAEAILKGAESAELVES